MAIVEVTVLPMGTADPSISPFVAACQKVLQEAEEISYRLTPMGTIIEGKLENIFPLIQKMHEVPFAAGVLRVGTIIRIDERRDKISTMDGKLRSVEEKLARMK